MAAKAVMKSLMRKPATVAGRKTPSESVFDDASIADSERHDEGLFGDDFEKDIGSVEPLKVKMPPALVEWKRGQASWGHAQSQAVSDYYYQ